ncbi:MAG: serine hydrolase [Proteobacteria bacterium]|nr:serine hydrolase [Pseudomonadota bacterium]
MLLTGLSALHLYNKDRAPEEQKTYQELLEEKILRPAEITNFSVTKPEGAMFDERDLVADKINGSPAGGYWVRAEDMQKFGKWLCQKWKEEGFREVTREFGQEFFDAKSQTVQHAGGIGGTPKNPGEEVPGSTTWFSVNPQSELVVVAGSKTHGGVTFGIGTTAAINLELERQAERAEANFKGLVAQGKKSKEAEGEIGNKKLGPTR